MAYKKWSEIKAKKLSPTKQTEIKSQVEREVKLLRELRIARQHTQTTLAAAMKKTQASVSKIESGTDLYVSTLRSYIEAMGGHLQVRAIFPDASIEIEQFAEDSELATINT